MPSGNLGSLVGKNVSLKLVDGAGALSGKLERVSDVDLVLKADDGAMFVVLLSAVIYATPIPHP